MREWFSQRRRKTAVTKRTGTSDPIDVVHALDFFIWSSLDDHAFEPQEPRPFGDDERHYNAILNRYYDIDDASTAQYTQRRFRAPDEPRPEGASFLAQYFPDENQFVMTAIVKDFYVTTHLVHRHDTLQEVAEVGAPVEGLPRLPSSNVLVNADAYAGYFNWLRDQGLRFAEATPEQREEVTVLAPMAAVIAPGVADEGHLLFTEGWVEVSHAFARELIQEFLDPEALLL